jgi:hypothetical protein
MNSGLRPNKLGIAQNPNDGFAGRPEAFGTSGGIAEDFLGKAINRPGGEDKLTEPAES